MSINLHTHNTIIASHVIKSAQGEDALMDDKSQECCKIINRTKTCSTHCLKQNDPIKFSLLTTADTPARIHNQQYHYIMKASCAHIAQGIKPIIVFPWLHIL